MPTIEKVKAVKLDVFHRYYNWICNRLDQNRHERKMNWYTKARAIKKRYAGQYEYSLLYKERGLDKIVFLERY